MSNNLPIEDNAVVLFGGSFDPVQNAHVEIVAHLNQRFSKTIVVPSFISPFKKKGGYVDPALRFEMLRIALANKLSVEVSGFEIEKGDVSYTIDTVRHFKNTYPNAPLYFAIGSEMLKKLPKWHAFDELKAMVNFYVIGRPGFNIADSLIKRLLTKHEAKLLIADFCGADTSSAQVRLDVAFDKFDSLPSAVAKMIRAQGLYRDFAPIIEVYTSFNLTDSERIAHIHRTAQTAIRLAKLHNANVFDVTVAALVHDIAKQADATTLKNMGVEVSDFADIPSKVQHGYWAAAALKPILNIRKKAIADAISVHTTGAPKMNKIAKMLILADYTEPGRDDEFDAEILNDIRLETKLNLAILKTLQAKAAHVEKKGGKVLPITQEAIEFYTPKPKVRKTGGTLVLRTPKTPAAVTNKSVVPVANKSPAIKVEKEKGIVTKPSTLPANTTEPLQSAPKKRMVGRDAHLAHTIAAALDEKKGRDVTLINLEGKTIIADYFVIASAFSSTAVKALADHVDEKLSKELKIEPLRRDVDRNWAAIDYGSVILHVQLEETREFYNLERLWSDGTNVTRYS